MNAASNVRKVGVNSSRGESETGHQVVVMAVRMDFCRLNLSGPVGGK